MADSVPLIVAGEDVEKSDSTASKKSAPRRPRVASLDTFRGFSIALMIFVDYVGPIAPIIDHTAWDGVHLADFTMPFFLFIAGISVSVVYKKTSNKIRATEKAMLRAVKLFILGVFLEGGYFHWLNSFSYGVDIDQIRWFGILQRIAVGYIVAALCEIWFSRTTTANVKYWAFKNYYLQWQFLQEKNCRALPMVIVVIILCGLHTTLLYGMYVPDWQFKVDKGPLNSILGTDYVLKLVKCDVRGDLGPACNAAGMIDRAILGVQHLYKTPLYRNLKECGGLWDGKTLGSYPSWCEAPFDPEGLLSSLTAVVTCILGLHFGHILFRLEDHKDRLINWSRFSVSILTLGLLLAFMGIPINKPLYTISYMLLTAGSAGITFCALYTLVDVYGYRRPTLVLEWMGRHSLSIFILVPFAIATIEGFYWRTPQNNLVHLIASLFE